MAPIVSFPGCGGRLKGTAETGRFPGVGTPVPVSALW